MKIGILTYFKNYNNGAFLQAYALSTYLARRYPEWKVEIINYQMKAERDFHFESIKMEINMLKIEKIMHRLKYINNINKLPLSKNKIVENSSISLAAYIDDNYDVVIVGSDELWKTNGYRGFPTPFWLNFELKKCKKCSYAVSSRSNLSEMSSDAKKIIVDALNDFEYIGVRDGNTYDELCKIGIDNVTINCDPTFMLNLKIDKEKNKKYFRKKYNLSDKKIIGVMLGDERCVRKLKERFGNEYQIVALYIENRSADKNLLSLSQFEWIRMISSCDFIITNLFHGTVFSILSGINFLAVDYESNGKIAYLLKQNNLDAHLLQITDKLDLYYEIAEKFVEMKNEKVNFSLCIKEERKKIREFIHHLERMACNDNKKQCEIE